MILIGDNNNSSKQITCNSSNSYTPIKIGSHNNTAVNVIKILIGDSNNIAREVYFMPLYDWSGLFYTKQYENETDVAIVDVIAKYKDNLYDRDKSLSEASVDTLIYSFHDNVPDNVNYIRVDFLEKSNYKNFNYMNKYSPYITKLELDTSKNIICSGLCGYNTNSTLDIYPDYKSLEHVVLNSHIMVLEHYCFTCTPNLKSVYIGNPNMGIDNLKGVFATHDSDCIFLWKVNKLGEYSKTGLQLSERYPEILLYFCVEDAQYYSDGLISANYDNDIAITASDYTTLYYSIDDVNNILGE